MVGCQIPTVIALDGLKNPVLLIIFRLKFEWRCRQVSLVQIEAAVDVATTDATTGEITEGTLR